MIYNSYNNKDVHTMYEIWLHEYAMYNTCVLHRPYAKRSLHVCVLQWWNYYHRWHDDSSCRVGHIPSPCSTNRPQPAVCSFPFPFLPSLLLSHRWRSLSLSRSLAHCIAVLLAVSLFVLVATLVLDVCLHVFFCDPCFGSECSGVSEFWSFLAEAAVRRVLRSNWFGSGVRCSVILFFFFLLLLLLLQNSYGWFEGTVGLVVAAAVSFDRETRLFVCLFVADTRDLFLVTVVCVTRSVDSGCVLLRFSSCQF